MQEEPGQGVGQVEVGMLAWYLVRLMPELRQERPRGHLSTGEPGAWAAIREMGTRMGWEGAGWLWSSESRGRGVGANPGTESDRKMEPN